ncbi:MAG: Sip1-related alpha-galactosidase [Algibacter sp.]|uniref:Sip1-related alpha-galactosidase n=1 Tax=Algibacter sp. TaxID=1872428 RepID=UPI00261D1FC4|nr:Sip1-related alpha-galactosidase [Algibacter sp.]MDG1729921.1 Sip1-related alpha-galactosidase [Algibacter sp.]
MNKNFKIIIILFFLAIFNISESFANEKTVKTKQDAEEVIAKTILNNESTFLSFEIENKANEHFFNLGKIQGFQRYSATYRNKSCWMIPSIGYKISDLPAETQFLLLDRGNSNYLMMIPLVDEKSRCSIGGLNSGELELIAETGDTLTNVSKFLGIYILSGNNPYKMIKKAAIEIQSKLKTFKLREQKKTPWLVDYFGWCTWNALGTDVSQDTLTYAMKHFYENNIPVKYMIVDNGWQDNKDGKLNSYGADLKKFPNGLAPMITNFKNNYGLEKIIMWQALWGTFAGLNESSFPRLEIKTKTFPVERLVMKHAKIEEYENINKVATMGEIFYPGKESKEIIIPDFIPYYNEYFDYLRKQGADGVKIDAMTWVESVGQNRGGRVASMKYMMQGLQSAVNVHFNNEMINCSSLSNDYIFNTLTSNLTRSSGDFFPEKPESHGAHIYTNAHNSFWLGEFILPDWDMFQSGHTAGAFHAAARAISGGPVYTTEEIGAENKDVLNKLMTSKGKLLRCKDVGRVCTSSLFTNPLANEKAVKIYNTNLVGGIVGAFNCSYNPENSVSVSEEIKATDIENIEGEKFAVYSFSNDELIVTSKKYAIPVKLKELDFDLFTYVPIQDGFAPIGVITKYNPGGMISEFNRLSEDIISLKLLEGGNFLSWSEKKPREVFANSKPVKFSYISNNLVVEVPQIEDVIVTITF